ncbi:MAG: hypothetical protein ACWA6X_14415 [Bauldia sp.]
MPLNAVWHKAHKMPPRATLDQRVTWHIEHAAACGCRPMPESIVAELARRQAAAKGAPGKD